LKRTIASLCIASLFVLLQPAWADPITVQFFGKVTQVPLDEVFGDIGVGDAIQGSFDFDTLAPDLAPSDASVGIFSWTAPFGMSVSVGVHSFSAFGNLNISVLNSFVDQYSVLATSALQDLTLELFLQDNTGSALSSDQLPAGAPLLAGFAQRDFHLDALFGSSEVQADGQITALSPPAANAPEPRTMLLVVTAALASMVFARRRLL
jgi:hypothetical protein